uniref:uncharacterized protein LOC124069739 n=1 Tax=Scatophagus argus TaxID=75038 RepID=UPI001ED82015|nr:uncharacterized protein LOC124069739 [Scatophagus argus]
MVVPPFPPPPYMEAPAYVLPHPHIQPVDYRRLLHPQVHAPSVSYHNPNHTRRIRLPHTGPVRETVNSAVQTEPTQRSAGGYSDRSPCVRSDSGHGTASSSPSSSSSSSQKQGYAEVEKYSLTNGNAKDLHINRTCTNDTVKYGFNIQHPMGTKTTQPHMPTVETQKCLKDSVGQENDPPYRNGHCNMWSVSSPDSMVPVCSSSQQEDEIVKERRISFPNILMNWGGGTPQGATQKMTDKVLPQNEHQLPSYETEVQHEKSVYQSPAEPETGPVVADSDDANVNAENSSKNSETLFKILKLPCTLHEVLSECRRENTPVGLVGSARQSLTYRDESLHSPNKSQQFSDDKQENGNETIPHDDITEIVPNQMSLNNCRMKRKMNESVWSVESLAPFIPTKERLLQKDMFEPKIIIETTEEAENGRPSTQNENLIVKSSKERRQSCRFSSSDSVPMSDSWLIFSTPAENDQSPLKKPEMESEADASKMRRPKQGRSMVPVERNLLVSPTCLPCKIILSSSTEEDVDENRSSEAEANQSQNQEKTPGSLEQVETLLLNCVAGMGIEDEGSGKEEVSQLRNEQLCIPIPDQRLAETSPSKGHLVDTGVQCTELQKCPCEGAKTSMGPSRMHPAKYSDVKANGGKIEGFSNGRVNKNQKRHGQWRNRGQGGNGRNPQC